MTAILLVEDDAKLCETIKTWLEHDEYSVDVSEDGNDAQSKIANFQYDLVILDWALPKQSGIDVLRNLRTSGDKTLVLMLTGKDSIEEKEQGLDAGADDYLTKPFSMNELSARIRALLRRPKGYVSKTLRIGNITLEPTTFNVLRNGEQVFFSRQEFNLLEFFMRHPNQLFTPEELLDHVWESASDVSPAVVRSYVKILRDKLDEKNQPTIIENVRGLGYRLTGKP